MKVILNADVSKLGYKGDVVKVADGYFRNFLYPRGLAVIVTEARMALAEKRREKVVLERERLFENIKETMGKLTGLKVEIPMKVTAKGTLYAALGEAKLISAVKAASNVVLEKKFIKFAEPIKTLGEHTVTVDFGSGHTVNIVVNVVKVK